MILFPYYTPAVGQAECLQPGERLSVGGERDGEGMRPEDSREELGGVLTRLIALH